MISNASTFSSYETHGDRKHKNKHVSKQGRYGETQSKATRQRMGEIGFPNS